MIKFWFYVYNIKLLPLLWLALKILSIFNPKIKEGFKGRKNQNLQNIIPQNNKKTVLIHSSSLGEYQQSIPIVEKLRELNFNVVLSFFSPSGYKNAKIIYDDVKKIYLPIDTYKNAKNFLDTISPDIIILMRYDLWFNFLYNAKKRKIKIIIANSRYDENDISLKIPILRSFKKAMYSMIDIMFAIDETDYENFSKMMSDTNCKVIKAGDSKFERVYEASKAIKIQEVIDKTIIENKKVFVIGSSWKEDEEIILPVVNKIIRYENLLTILVPHEPKETKISAIEKNIETNYPNLKTIWFSNLENYKNENLIIVDSIGKLMGLYSIAYLAYVGGGFKTGLHNVLEPAIFNIPVFFANEEKNSDEDEIMISKGCGIKVESKKQFYKEFRSILKDKDYYECRSGKCKEIFTENMGTTKKIIENIINQNV